MLSEEQLKAAYNGCKEGGHLGALAAVAEAAVKEVAGGEPVFWWLPISETLDELHKRKDHPCPNDHYANRYIPLYTRPQASAAVPENMAVVPRTMILKPEAMEALQFILGGCELDNDEAPLDERWLSGILFFGEVEDDHGKVVHGLHVYSEDYPEEGSVTLVEFAASQPEVK